MPRNADGSGSNPRVGKKTREAIAHLVNGTAKTQKQAAKLAGMTPTELSRALKKPHVQAYAVEAGKLHLQGFPALLAAARLTKLIGAKSEDVAARVATRIAEGAGVLPSREAATGPIGGTGPVLAIVFKHVQPPGIGAPSVQVIDGTAQVVDRATLPAPIHYPAEVAWPSDGGPGGLDDAPAPAGAGVEKRAADARRPPSRTEIP